MSHAATTWQSGCSRKALVFAGPIMPQPMTPTVMRFEAEGRACPQALAGRMAAAPAAAPADLMKARREKGDLSVGSERRESDRRFFIVVSGAPLFLRSTKAHKSVYWRLVKKEKLMRRKSSTMALARDREDRM